MDVTQAELMLDSMRPQGDGLSTEVGQRAGEAYLLLTADSEVQPWAVVRTPGTRWFSVELSGGYSLDYVDEEASDDETKDYLSRLISIAVAHVEGKSEVIRRRWPRHPILTVDLGTERVQLNPTLGWNLVASLFGRH